MGSYVIMPVSNRIKIIKCASFEEAENKVNDFLAFDENITQLVQIDYRLEFNVVIIDYVINGEDDDHGGDHDSNNKMSLGDLSYGYNTSPLISWWKLCFPFRLG